MKPPVQKAKELTKKIKGFIADNDLDLTEQPVGTNEYASLTDHVIDFLNSSPGEFDNLDRDEIRAALDSGAYEQGLEQCIKNMLDKVPEEHKKETSNICEELKALTTNHKVELLSSLKLPLEEAEELTKELESFLAENSRDALLQIDGSSEFDCMYDDVIDYLNVTPEMFDDLDEGEREQARAGLEADDYEQGLNESMNALVKKIPAEHQERASILCERLKELTRDHKEELMNHLSKGSGLRM